MHVENNVDRPFSRVNTTLKSADRGIRHYYSTNRKSFYLVWNPTNINAIP
jgi:hypothetical protein